MLNKCSMSTLKDGDYLNAPEQTIICTTNTVGAMGRGIALSVKNKYPKVWIHYKKLCNEGKMNANFLCSIGVGDNKRILLFPTKIHWRRKSNVDQITDNLTKLLGLLDALKVESLAIPPLGMGNGWLNDKESKIVMAAIESFAEESNIPCTFYS